MSMFVDIHTHNKNKEGVISVRSFSFGKDIIELADGLCSVGIHPWHLTCDYEEAIAEMERLLSSRNIVCVGEIGVDRLCGVDIDLQISAFREQLKLAQRYGLPVVIHCVRAYSEVGSVIKKLGFSYPVIFHGFRGKWQLAEKLLSCGFYISFGRYYNAEVAKNVPLCKVLLETDEIGDISDVYHSFAEARKITVQELTAIVRRNFEKVLRI